MSHATAAFAVSTYSYQQQFSARDAMAHFAERGYTEFELMMFPGHIWPDALDAPARRELRRFIETSRLRVPTLSIANNDLNVASAYPGLRDYSIGLLSSIVHLAGWAMAISPRCRPCLPKSGTKRGGCSKSSRRNPTGTSMAAPSNCCGWDGTRDSQRPR